MHLSRWITGALVALALSAAPRAEAQSRRLTGAKLGTMITVNAEKIDVVVKRELSPEDGFPADQGGRWQAQGAARAALSTTAAVIQDARGRWHAVEANVLVANGAFTSSRPDVRAVVAVQGCSAERYARLKAEASAAHETWTKDRANTAALGQVETAYVRLMTEAFGLDAATIAVVRRESDAAPTKVSFMVGFTKAEAITVTSGTAHRDPLPAGDRADPKKRRAAPAIVLGPGTFSSDLPRAAGILVHEGTHASHMTRADALLEEWRGTGRKASFVGWLDKKKTRGEISLEDFDTTAEQANGGSAQTEVLASANELVAAFPTMRTADPMATKPFLDMNAYGPLGDTQQKRLYARLEALYVTLDPAHKRLFDDAMAKEKRASGRALSAFAHRR